MPRALHPRSTVYLRPFLHTSVLTWPSAASTSVFEQAVRGWPGLFTYPREAGDQDHVGEVHRPRQFARRELKGQETEPQSYLEGKLLVSSSRKIVQEITDIVTWVEAFTVYMYSWIFCSAHPSRWQDMTQYKLLILKTSHQFLGKAWLHYDIAFRKDAAASGLADWSCMNLDLYNFHTCLPPQSQTSQRPSTSASSSSSGAFSSNFCRSWNHGTCLWPFGQCQFRHPCERCEGDHPRVNCPFLASKPHNQGARSSSPPRSKRQRRWSGCQIVQGEDRLCK